MKYLFAILLFFALSLISCDFEKEGPKIFDNYEVLYANSFEDSTDLEDLELIGANIENDSAPDAGEKSLDIEPQWLPVEGYMAKNFYLTLEDSDHVLPFYFKTENGTGHAILAMIASYGFEEIISEQILEYDEWFEKYVHYIPEFNPGEFLRFKVLAGSTEVTNWHIYIDNLKMIKKL